VDPFKIDQFVLGAEVLWCLLKDNEVKFVLVTLRLTLEGIEDQVRNIVIQWFGPQSKRLEQNSSNMNLQKAIDTLKPNHGKLLARGKREFTYETIIERWAPNAGSHELE